MIKQFVLLCTLVCLSAAQQQGQQIKHFLLNDANLIETSRGYAISGPSLLPNGWKAVSVNDNSVQIIGANCQERNLSKQDLLNSGQDQNSVNNAIQMLHSIQAGRPNLPAGQNERNAVVTFSLTSLFSMSTTLKVRTSTFNNNGVSIMTYDDRDLTVSKQPSTFPNNINRIFVIGDMVTYVFNDGRVQMKPDSCLQASEHQLIAQIRGEADEAKRQLDLSMQKMQQDMQRMNAQMERGMRNGNAQMQRGMQNLQQAMQNMNNQMGRNMHNVNNQMGGGMQNMQQAMQNMNNQMQMGMGQGMQMNMGNMNPSNMFQRNGGFSNQGFPQNNGFNQNNGFGQNNQSPMNMAGGRPTMPGLNQAMGGANWPLDQTNMFQQGFPFQQIPQYQNRLQFQRGPPMPGAYPNQNGFLPGFPIF